MRVLSMDEGSNWFRACFYHGDTSICHNDTSVQNAQEMQKTKCACARNRVRKICSTGSKVRSTPNQIAQFKLL